MAKQIGVVQFSGALGEVVGNKKSPGQKKNSLRVRVTPRNPRTELQMVQRLKTKAAMNVYSALKEILDHSFEGIQYGAPSRNYFMQQAMLLPEGSFPWLVKGDSNPVPGAMMISKGALQPVGTFFIEEGTHFPRTNYPDVADDYDINTITLADFSQKFIEANNVQNGDQLTFVCFCRFRIRGGQFFYQPSFCRVVLDINNTETTFANAVESSNANFRFSIDSEGFLAFYLSFDGTTTVDEYFGAAIIVSRPHADGDNVEWQRSTSYITIPEFSDVQALFSDDAKAKALASFKKALNPQSAWYLNQGKLS